MDNILLISASNNSIVYNFDLLFKSNSTQIGSFYYSCPKFL